MKDEWMKLGMNCEELMKYLLCIQQRESGGNGRVREWIEFPFKGKKRKRSKNRWTKWCVA